MKRTLFATLAIIAVFASCSKEQLVKESVPQTGETAVFNVVTARAKTTLGENTDGVYPNYWAEGDKISVNGVESNALTAQDAGQSAAQFTVQGVSSPYYVAYPAAAVSGYDSGSAVITVPSAQTYVEDSYDPAAFVMLAGTSSDNVTFSPATTVLKFTPTGSYSNIASVSVTALGGKKIAGTFTTDYSALTAGEGAVSEVKVSAPAVEGVALGKSWYVCVPAGDYSQDGIQVTIETVNGSKMTKTATFESAFTSGRIYSFTVPFIPDYVKGVADLNTMLSGKVKLDYRNLVIDGNNETVANDVMHKMIDVVGTVSGEVVFKNIKGWSMVEHVISGSNGSLGVNTIKPLGSIRFINCPDLNNFGGMRGLSKINGDLEIDGSKPYWGWGSFAYITEITGNVIIKNPTSKANGGSSMNTGFFSGLKKVGGDFHFENCNGCDFWQFCDIDIEEIGGYLKVIGCTAFNNFSAGNQSTHTGVMALKKLGGVYMTRNGAITDNTNGWNVIQGYIDNGVVDYDNVECYKSDGTTRVVFKKAPGNLTLTGSQAIAQFVAAGGGKQNFKNLTIDGNGDTISDTDMSLLKTVVGNVLDTLTIKNIKGWTMIEQVISTNEQAVKPLGSIRIIDCPDINNINGFKSLTKVNGDFIMKNTPKAAFTWGAGNCLNNLVEVTGDFTLDNATDQNLTGTTCLMSLAKVGGNFTITNINLKFWDLRDMPLTEIGGDFIYKDNALVNSFLGFGGLTKIGGKLLVKGTAITDFSQVQTWIDNNVISVDNVECYGKSGNRIIFNLPANYSLVGSKAVTEFVNSGSGIHNFKTLTIDGNNETIDNNTMSKLKLVVGEVSDEIVFKNIKGWSMVEQAISGTGGSFSGSTVKALGSIRFINCPDLSNFGGMRAYSKINGDLEINGCPIYWTWSSLVQITEITGNLIVKDPGTYASNTACNMNTGFFSGLKKVGGDFHFENCNSCQFWQFEGIDVKEIGGTLKVINCTAFQRFSTSGMNKGVSELTKLGGVYVTKCGAIASIAEQKGSGWDVIQKYIDTGIVAYDKVECYATNGTTKIAFTPKSE
ncbi:MAG: fimbrillin family protein [Bacteroidales bacterium]|nr:fimbrillin family protein [Bacteroidales bacterium]